MGMPSCSQSSDWTNGFEGLFTLDTIEPNSMRIECALVMFTLFIHKSILGDGNWMRIQPNPPLEVIGTESKPNILFIHWITIKSHTVTSPWTAALSKLSRLGHHTCCIRCPRYHATTMACHPGTQLTRCCSLLKTRPLTKWSRLVHQNSHSTSSTISDKVR